MPATLQGKLKPEIGREIRGIWQELVCGKNMTKIHCASKISIKARYAGSHSETLSV